LQSGSTHFVAKTDFDRIESHTGVVAGLVPATPNVEAQSKNNRGGRDKPGHDAGRHARWFNLTGIRSKSSLLLRPDRCGPHARRRLAEVPAEHAIEMRDVAKAGRKGDIKA